MRDMFDWITDNKGKFLSLVIVLFYFMVFLFVEGSGEAFQSLVFCLLALSFIWFGDIWGNITGCFIRGHVITQKTPGCFIAFLGWVILLLPLVFAILASIGILE